MNNLNKEIEASPKGKNKASNATNNNTLVSLDGSTL
jgi:hypothetical protein